MLPRWEFLASIGYAACSRQHTFIKGRIRRPALGSVGILVTALRSRSKTRLAIAATSMQTLACPIKLPCVQPEDS